MRESVRNEENRLGMKQTVNRCAFRAGGHIIGGRGRGRVGRGALSGRSRLEK